MESKDIADLSLLFPMPVVRGHIYIATILSSWIFPLFITRESAAWERSGRTSSIFVGTQRVRTDIHEVISVSDPFRCVSRKVAMAGQSPFSWDDWIWRRTSPLMSAENPKIFTGWNGPSSFYDGQSGWWTSCWKLSDKRWRQVCLLGGKGV